MTVLPYIPDDYWRAYSESGQLVGEGLTIEQALKQANDRGFADPILNFGVPELTKEQPDADR